MPEDAREHLVEHVQFLLFTDDLEGRLRAGRQRLEELGLRLCEVVPDQRTGGQHPVPVYRDDDLRPNRTVQVVCAVRLLDVVDDPW